MSEQRSNHLAALMSNWVAGNKLRETCLFEIALAAGEGDQPSTDALKLATSSESAQEPTALAVACVKGLGKCGIVLESAENGARIIPVDCLAKHKNPL